nr:MAG TPA: hypothetical protein [Caudoviricetes sp.]
MRHRIAEITGIGNPEPCRLDNNIKIEKNEFWDKFLQDCETTFPIMADCEGFDYHLAEHGFFFGIEPSYIMDEMLMVYINFHDINSCSIERGIALGYYGSNVVSKIKMYRQYKRKSKFIRFIDKWYEPITTNKELLK